MEEIVKGRMGMYAFFSSVFLDVPPKELLKEIYEGRIAFPKLEGVEEIFSYAKGFDSFEDFEREIRREYTDLFVNPFKEHVSLYKSDYFGDYPYGNVTLKTIEKFKEFGYIYEHTEPADHLGVFMAFMVKSCEEFLKGNREELKKQREILEDLESWIYEFCEKVESSEDARFYRGVVKMLRDFLKMDRKILNELILNASD